MAESDFKKGLPQSGDTKEEMIEKIKSSFITLQTQCAAVNLSELQKQTSGEFQKMKLHLDKNASDLHEKLHKIAATLDELSK